MSHSYCNLLYHIVFSTKDRQPWLHQAIRPKLCAYLGGVVRRQGGIAIAVYAMPEHVHVLAKLRADKPVSDIVQALKSGSSAWIRRSFRDPPAFAWQRGYGMFSVSQSQARKVQRYIENQEEHHRTKPYGQEFVALLRAHRIPFDEHEVWD